MMRTTSPARRRARPRLTGILTVLCVLLFSAGAPRAAVPSRCTGRMDSVRDAIRVIEAELAKFDGKSPPSTTLESAADELRTQLGWLRGDPECHALVPPSLDRISDLCNDLAFKANPHSSALVGLRRVRKYWTEEFRTHSVASRTARDKLLKSNLKVLGGLWINGLPTPQSITFVLLADTFFDIFQPTGKPSGDPYIQKYGPEITRRAEARFFAERPTLTSEDIKKSRYHPAIVTILFEETVKLSQEKRNFSHRHALRATDAVKKEEAAEKAYAAIRLSFVTDICAQVGLVSMWTPTVPTPPKPPKPPPGTKPTPPKPTPPTPVIPCPPGNYVVPYVIFEQLPAAEAAIRSVCLTPIVVKREHSYHHDRGEVIFQVPYLGTEVPQGTLVSLTVSLGAPQMEALTIEPPVAYLDIGETIEFAARMDYSDGTHNYLTYGSTWTPGPGYKFTAKKAGTVRITATIFGLTASATVYVGDRDYPTAPALPDEDTILPSAGPEEFTWYVLCEKRTGEVTYARSNDPVNYFTMAGPFAGPRGARAWVVSNCPNWRCTSAGQCANDPAPAVGGAGWLVICDRRTGAVTLSKTIPSVNHSVMAGPYLGEPDARSWVETNCANWRCDSNGVCAPDPAPAVGGDGWLVLCNRRTGAITLAKSAPSLDHSVMAGPYLGEPDARSWVEANCPSWRCDSNGRCAAGPAPATGSDGWFVLCNRESGVVSLSKQGGSASHTAKAGPFLGEPDARAWVETNCPSWRCNDRGACVAGDGSGLSGAIGETGGGEGGDPDVAALRDAFGDAVAVARRLADRFDRYADGFEQRLRELGAESCEDLEVGYALAQARSALGEHDGGLDLVTDTYAALMSALIDADEPVTDVESRYLAAAGDNSALRARYATMTSRFTSDYGCDEDDAVRRGEEVAQGGADTDDLDSGFTSGDPNAVEVCGDGVDNDGDLEIDECDAGCCEGAAVIRVADCGSLADDSFLVQLDTGETGVTPVGSETTFSADLSAGTHTVTLTVLQAPDGIGTYCLTIEVDGVLLLDAAGGPPEGTVVVETFEVPTPGPASVFRAELNRSPAAPGSMQER